MLVGAVASASNVFAFQAIYFSRVSPGFILVMAGLSAVSGALLGGYLAWDLHRLLSTSKLLSRSAGADVPAKRTRLVRFRDIVTGLVVMAFLAGGVTYYVTIYDPFASPGEVQIAGAVESPQTFRYEAWDEELVAINAELRGSVTAVPAQDYTGIPLRRLLERAAPTEDARTLRVIADDGYEASFDLAEVMADPEMILILEDGRLRLVAANYDGGSWVRRVTRLVVE
jgi:energy-coupling factor transport system substrate-specific component